MTFSITQSSSEELEHSFQMIYQNYYRMMLKIAYDILHDSYLAEDTVQDTFIKLLKISHKLYLQNKTKMKSLMIVMTRNTAIDYYRKRHRENLTFIDNGKNYSQKTFQKSIFTEKIGRSNAGKKERAPYVLPALSD